MYVYQHVVVMSAFLLPRGCRILRKSGSETVKKRACRPCFLEK